MTREEQILEQALKYANQVSTEYTIPESIARLVKGAFVAGSVFADEHPVTVWHPTTELPRDKFIAILKDGTAVCGVLTHISSYYDEEYGVFTYEDSVKDWNFVDKWAYIKDLLQK